MTIAKELHDLKTISVPDALDGLCELGLGDMDFSFSYTITRSPVLAVDSARGVSDDLLRFEIESIFSNRTLLLIFPLQQTSRRLQYRLY